MNLICLLRMAKRLKRVRLIAAAFLQENRLQTWEWGIVKYQILKPWCRTGTENYS
jgi:hypothetical protein